jgi:hypothetical protein
LAVFPTTGQVTSDVAQELLGGHAVYLDGTTGKGDKGLVDGFDEGKFLVGIEGAHAVQTRWGLMERNCCSAPLVFRGA